VFGEKMLSGKSERKREEDGDNCVPSLLDSTHYQITGVINEKRIKRVGHVPWLE
jgi:hypothetical protein